MATYYDKQAENYKSQLEFQRQEINLWKERMDAAKSAGNEDAYEKFKENDTYIGKKIWRCSL